jgi:hypothetical protein
LSTCALKRERFTQKSSNPWAAVVRGRDRCNHLVTLLDVAMPHADQMREHASRLFAMALTARDKGKIEYADRLTEQASDVLDAAAATEIAQRRHLK